MLVSLYQGVSYNNVLQRFDVAYIPTNPGNLFLNSPPVPLESAWSTQQIFPRITPN